MYLRKIAYTIVFLTLLLGLISSVALDVITTEMRKEFKKTQTTARQLGYTNALLRSVSASNRYNMLWIVTRKKKYLDQRNKAREEASELLGFLKKSEELNANEMGILYEAEHSVNSIFAFQDEQATSGVTKPIPSEVDALYARLDPVTKNLQGLVDAKAKMLDRLNDENSGWEDVSDLIARLAETLMGLLFIAIIWLLHRQLFQPLQHLLRTIVNFRNGRADARVRVTEMRFKESKEAALAFNELADWLNEVERRKMEYLGSVAHDIRNPLSAMKAVLAFLRNGDRALVRQKSTELLQLMSQQTDRIEQLVTDWMDVQRIERGELILRVSTVDFRKTVEESVQLWNTTATRHSIELREPSAPLVVICDPDRMAQVLNNLISNAIKYSPNGGRIAVELESAGSFASFSVTDFGLGIGERDLKHLYEPFRRSTDVRDTIPGVGLGLSISKKIIEAHGGSITVESKLGRGSRFTIRIPVYGTGMKAA